MSDGQAPGRPTLWILIGLPCAGKSWWRRSLNRRVTTISSDDLIEQAAKGMGTTYTEAFRLMDHDAILRRIMGDFRSAVLARRDIVVDRTNLTTKSRHRFLSGAPGYRKVAMLFEVAPATHDQRLSDARKAGKDITPEVFNGMRDRYTPPSYAEGFDVIEPSRHRGYLSLGRRVPDAIPA